MLVAFSPRQAIAFWLHLFCRCCLAMCFWTSKRVWGSGGCSFSGTANAMASARAGTLGFPARASLSLPLPLLCFLSFLGVPSAEAGFPESQWQAGWLDELLRSRGMRQPSFKYAQFVNQTCLPQQPSTKKHYSLQCWFVVVNVCVCKCRQWWIYIYIYAACLRYTVQCGIRERLGITPQKIVDALHMMPVLSC